MGDSQSRPAGPTLDVDIDIPTEESEEAVAVSIDQSISEQRIRGASVPLPMRTLLDISQRAVCKIEVEGATGTGFLAKFPTANGSLVHGLFANNQVLTEGRLVDNGNFKIRFDAIPEGTTVSENPPSFTTKVTVNNFRFTCPVLDATFVHFEKVQVDFLTSRGCLFLEVATEWNETQDLPLFMLQQPRGAEIHLPQGMFLQYYGLDMFHSVSTDYGSSGLPVIRSDGQIMGLYKVQSAVASSNHNIAVTMRAVIEAVRPHFNNPATISRHLVCNLDILEPAYASELLQIGLQQCFLSPTSNFQGLMYVSPATIVRGVQLVTPIWFAPTSHGWYWTPNDPSSKITETNWMPVSQLKVIGGYWNGQVPAAKNIKIIQWLLHHNIQCGVCPVCV